MPAPAKGRPATLALGGPALPKEGPPRGASFGRSILARGPALRGVWAPAITTFSTFASSSLRAMGREGKRSGRYEAISRRPLLKAPATGRPATGRREGEESAGPRPAVAIEASLTVGPEEAFAGPWAPSISGKAYVSSTAKPVAGAVSGRVVKNRFGKQARVEGRPFVGTRRFTQASPPLGAACQVAGGRRPTPSLGAGLPIEALEGRAGSERMAS